MLLLSILSPITLQPVPHPGLGLRHQFYEAKIERQLGSGVQEQDPQEKHPYLFSENLKQEMFLELITSNLKC